MKKRKNNNILRFIVLIIAIAILCYIGYLIYEKLIFNKMENLLESNDSTNYELVQADNGATVKVCGKIMISEDEDSVVWISENENLRVIMDKNSKVAIITDNPEEQLKVVSLNSTYINDYFENSKMKFKYLGKENGYYKIQFTNKNTETVTIFYINEESGIIEKMVEEFNEMQNTYEFDVTLNCVSEDDVEYPDLTEYDVGASSSSVVEEGSDESEDINENNMESAENLIILTTEE